MLPGIWNIISTVLPCADNLVVLAAMQNYDTNQSGGLTIPHTTDGSSLLPDVSLKGLPPQTVATLLESFLHDVWSKFFSSLIDSGDIEVSFYRLHSTFRINSQNSLGQIGWVQGSLHLTCIPSYWFERLCPTSMGLSNVYQLYEHIISSQKSPDKQLFQFTFHDSILPLPITKNLLLIVSPLASSPSSKLPSPCNIQPEIRGSDEGANNKFVQKWKVDDEMDTNANAAAEKSKRRCYITVLYCKCQLCWPSQFQ